MLFGGKVESHKKSDLFFKIKVKINLSSEQKFFGVGRKIDNSTKFLWAKSIQRFFHMK
jgi:hypothetical protein